jgi:PAS domain S-box-containing protein
MKGQETVADILAVDDTMETLDILVSMLSEYGFKVRPATSVEIALRAARSIPPDLILLNHKMADMDGYQVCQVLKDDDRTCDIPIIFLSDHDDPRKKVKAYSAGAVDYVTKPFQEEEIVARVQTNLSLRNLQKRLQEQETRLEQEIADRERAEEALLRSEQKFRLICEHAPWAYQSLDERGCILDANQAWLNHLGYSRDEVVGKWIGNFLHSDSIGALEERFPRFMEKGEVRQVEFSLVRKDGSVFPILLDGNIEYDDTGHFKRTHCVFMDISKRKLSDEALRESESKLRRIFETSPAGIVYVSSEGRILDCNPAYARICRYEKAELVTKTVMDLTHPDDLNRELVLVDRLRRQEIDTYAIEKRYIRKDGVEVWIQEFASVIFDENERVDRFVGVVQDITERKKIEDALRQSEQRFRAVFNNASVGIDLLDRFGRFVEVNSALANMLGYTKEELVERTALDLTHPDDLEQSKANLEPLFEGVISSYQFEKRFMRKDGTIVWADVAASDIRNSYGYHEATVGVISDITQRKRAEDLIRLRLDLLEFVATHSLEELLQKTLDEVGNLTDSPIGFYHFVNEDQETLSLQAWSTRTVKEFCFAAGKGRHYPITEAGVWVDCVREKRPVIHNDYASLSHRKGLPEGHAPVIRELVVPIMRSGLIVAILGIGNKPSDYTQEDVETVSYIADVAWEIFERRRAEEQVKVSLSEKEILLREIHHRVKNNLTLVCSLLSLQAGYADEKHRRLFEDLEARVMSMALAHEKLYKSESLAALDLDEYIGGLLDHLVGSACLGISVQLSKEIHDVSFGLDTAIPVGFILTELVSNCLKHAFPLGTEGKIEITLRSFGEDAFELVVRDNGIGFPRDIDAANAASLGMDLVHAFARRLKGSIEILRDNGTQVRITFKEI